MASPSHQLVELWRRLSPTLLLLARTRCDIAEDCVQEAFIRLSTQDPIPDDPAAWLVRVVRNAAIDMARAEKRRRDREHRAERHAAAWFVEPEDFDRSLCEEEVRNALQNLPPEDRDIVVAHLWGGLSFRQIAEAMEIGSSTAHRKYVEAITKLRQAFQSMTHPR
jgi:RNA polymerase sigma factor (sigma-70 family)